MKIIVKKNFYRALGFVGGFLFIAVVTNAVISKFSFPETGRWTGIWPLEQKMKLLEQFAQEGPVDALFLGSSLSDAGINAEEFSRLMTKHLGRPYRAFNFSTGAAEISLYPALYRIAKTVVKPKVIYAIAPIESKRAEVDYPDSPEDFLARSPAGLFLNSEQLLAASHWVWSMPIIKEAASFKEFIINGQNSIRMEGADTTYVSPFGDRIGFYVGSKKMRKEIFSNLRPLEESKYKRPQGPPTVEHYFTRVDIKGMDELVKLTSEDGIKIELINHVATSYTIYPPDQHEEYRFCREQYIQVMANRHSLKAHSFLSSFWIAPYQLMDTSHLNYFGSIYFTRRLFTEMTGEAVENKLVKLAPDFEQIPDDYIESFTQVILRENGEKRTKLQLKLMSSRFGLPTFESELWISLLTYDRREFIVPAKLGKDTIEADFPDFPKNGPEQAIVLKVLGRMHEKYYTAYAPLREYQWTK